MMSYATPRRQLDTGPNNPTSPCLQKQTHRTRRASRPLTRNAEVHRDDNEGADPKKRWLDRLRTHLKPLEFDGQLTICSDLEITIGDDWREHIQTHLKGAHAAVLLISSNFMASEFIRNSELPVLLRRAKEQGPNILPVLVGPSRFDKAKFKYPDPKTGPEEFTLASLQAAGSPDKTLIEMNDGEQERTLLAVANRIEQVVQGASQNPA